MLKALALSKSLNQMITTTTHRKSGVIFFCVCVFINKIITNYFSAQYYT